jgi:predicted RNase H-like HicB family nuclease
MLYAVVIEKGERNYSAYVPDLPGCVSVGDTQEDVKAEIREAIEFHLEGMRDDGVQLRGARGPVIAGSDVCKELFVTFGRFNVTEMETW